MEIKFDEAINILNTVINLDPNNASAFAWRGKAYWEKRLKAMPVSKVFENENHNESPS